MDAARHISITAIAAIAAAGSACAQPLTEDRRLVGADTAATDSLGTALDAYNSVLLVGAAGVDEPGIASGAAYLFDVPTGAQLARFRPDDLASGDQFGVAASVFGDRALVGAPLADTDAASGTGRAYLYDITDRTAPTPIATLAPDALNGNAAYGFSVATTRTHALVGAPQFGASGAVFVHDARTGDLLRTLTPANPDNPGDYFGASVDLRGDIAIIGAWQDDDNGPTSGAAYLFDVSTGAQLAKILPSVGAAQDRFGRAVAIDGDHAAISAHLSDLNGPDSGAVFLFDVSSPETPAEIAVLTPPDASPGERFGNALDIEGDTIAVGASNADAAAGAAYLFRIPTGEQLAQLVSATRNAGDRTGHSVSLSYGSALTGAIYDDDAGEDAGAVLQYIFDIPCAPADLAGPFALLDLADINAFIAAFLAGDAPADLDGNGLLDLTDLALFAASFPAGCP